jgi:hypothetical protein
MGIAHGSEAVMQKCEIRCQIKTALHWRLWDWRQLKKDHRSAETSGQKLIASG